jgi:excisionase family DNA binding protein
MSMFGWTREGDMITRDDCATFGFPVLERTYTIASDGLLRISQVCALLNIERHTVYKLIECDVLPSIRITERITRIPAAAVEKLMTPR